MSFLTATNTELIYCMNSAAADVTVSTASQLITPASGSTVEGAYLPPIFSIWQPSTIVGKGMRVVVGGIYDVAAADNVTLTHGLNTAQTTTISGASIGITLAGTGASPFPSATAGGFYGQFDINFQGFSGGGAGQVQGYVNGILCAGAANQAGTSQVTTGNVTLLGGKTSSGASAFAFTAWVGTTAYWWEAIATVATAPTHFALQQHMIYGLN